MKLAIILFFYVTIVLNKEKNLKIFTSSYQECKGFNNVNTISISGDRGKKENYQGACYKGLAPKYFFWKIWHDNIGKISDEEKKLFYIKSYIDNVLNNLSAKSVANDLDGKILLCYENPNEFCHRHIVSAWLERDMNLDVNEVAVVGNRLQTKQDSNIDYIKQQFNKIYQSKEEKLFQEKCF